MTLTFTLTDQLPSGKNAIRETYIRGKKVRYPNQRFVKWRQAAAAEIMSQKVALNRTYHNDHTSKDAWPLKGPLSAAISYCPTDHRQRDVPGMMDALWHLLEHCRIVEDDGQIQSVAWKRKETQSHCVLLTLHLNKGGNREH